jgi:hypothetical protein
LRAADRCSTARSRSGRSALSRRLGDKFSLVGLGLPAGGDEASPWDVCYFVAAAGHYFTAFFEDGRAASLTVDG